MKLFPFENIAEKLASVSRHLRVYGTPPCFSVISTKGNNSHDFLFASPADTPLQKLGLLLKEFAPTGAIFFPLRVKSLLRREANI